MFDIIATITPEISTGSIILLNQNGPILEDLDIKNNLKVVILSQLKLKEFSDGIYNVVLEITKDGEYYDRDECDMKVSENLTKIEFYNI